MPELFLTQDFPPATGGIARLYDQLCRHFPAGSVEVCTVAAPPDHVPAGLPVAARAAAAAGAGLVVHRMPFAAPRAKLVANVVRWGVWAMRRVRAGDVTLIHAGELRPTGYIAAWARVRHNLPYVLYVHGHDVWKETQRIAGSPRRRATARWILGGAAAIIANSRATAARASSLLERLGLTADRRVRVVHPGTDPARFRPAAPGAGGWRARLRAPAGSPLLLTVARLVRRKGVDTVIRALPSLGSAVYIVAGDGPDRPRLETMADRLGVRERVHFVGAVEEDELPGLFAAADVFVMPAREEPGGQEVEGFGIVYCEAAAAGLPVVAARSGGVAEAVREGETALLVPPDDVAALNAALDRLLRDVPLRLELGRAGRRAVESYFNWARAAAEVREILAGIPRQRATGAAEAREVRTAWRQAR